MLHGTSLNGKVCDKSSTLYYWWEIESETLIIFAKTEYGNNNYDKHVPSSTKRVKIGVQWSINIIFSHSKINQEWKLKIGTYGF